MQEVLDRISMSNPHSLIVAAMDTNGKVLIAKIQHDPGVECLLAKGIELAVNQSIGGYLVFDPQKKADAIPPTTPGFGTPN